MSELQEDHFLPFEDFKAEYADVRETEVINRALGWNPPSTMKLPFNGRHDLLVHSVKEMLPGAASILIIDPAFKSKDGQPFMIQFPLSGNWRGQIAQQIRSFNITAFIEGNPKIGLAFAFLKITENRRGDNK